jgi:hypothetical protein
MPSKTASRAVLAFVPSLIACGALAAPAQALVAPIAPHQPFYGQVFGVASASTQDVIEVICVGPLATGHPAAGQSVEVQLPVPPPGTSLGYTGNFGTSISADLTWSRGTVTVVTHVASFTSYGVMMPIPTSLTVPCGGSGVMGFTPSPDPDNSGRASDVSVTFRSAGV